MAKYKVVYDRQSCIGAAQCVTVYSKRWCLAKDGKADLKGSKKTNAEWTLEIDEKELAEMKESAAACPVNVIHLFDIKTGKKLI
ncbi:ferredoxin [Candidatus Woesearchaeota archaeon]|nr:ferredoxin [Candidatus Woesearchaeota archaeon]